MLLAVVTIPAVINVGIGYVTRDQPIDRVEIITYRDYVGVSSALLLFVALVAPDVVCPDRRQRVLPLMFARPLTGVDYVVAKVGAIATIMFAFSFLPQVAAVRRQHAGQRQRPRLPQGPPRRAVDGPGRRRPAGRLLRRDRRGHRLADRPPDRRRGRRHRPVPRDVDRLGDPRRRGAPRRLAGRADQRARPAAVPARLVFLGHVDPTSPLGGVAYGGAMAIGIYLAVLPTGVGVLLWRYRWVER